jgi:choline-phosphate cytidylyltransferase
MVDPYRIVRDYDKYIARQFKRGASRQELNVSWLKKNELEIKRHVAELRESIRNNWTMTGQELTKEFRQLWQISRPGSPARSERNSFDLSNPRSSTNGAFKSQVPHLDTPNRPESPGPAGRSEDFVTGYSLGLIGGVRSWVGIFHSCHSLDHSLPLFASSCCFFIYHVPPSTGGRANFIIQLTAILYR